MLLEFAQGLWLSCWGPRAHNIRKKMCHPSSNQADHDLVCKLAEIAGDGTPGKSVRSTTYEIQMEDKRKEEKCAVEQVQSWKMREWDYYKVPPRFPTLARGLFTTQDSDEDGGRYRIVARGYDKFFNLGEVPWTAWEPLKEHTCPPYIMTLKSNGCIIFIAALTPSKLLITSKHAIGKLEGDKTSHSEMGETWLYRHLEKKGKTEKQLARVLWDKNWTAVAELCDDSFEEHVLRYSPEKTGLHLHGLNKSSGEFKTEPSEDVAEFAREWGFIETPFRSLSSIDDVKEFTNTVAKEGFWNGEPIEGFVVRCHVKDGSSLTARDSPPYPPGSSFFFKVKFDEPYLMYRDWREITRTLLACDKEKESEHAGVPLSKLRSPESKLYLKWVKRDIVRNRELFDDFDKGRGVIATRERFLQYCRERNDKSDVDSLDSVKDAEITEFSKTVIMPVAIPGCGKTTVAIALSSLFGFGHVQSDDIPGKKSGPKFLKCVVEDLKDRDVVIADKNNHTKVLRSSLREAVKDFTPPVRILALHWDLDLNSPPSMIRICADRIVGRGDNHQELIADPEEKNHETVIWRFLKQMEPLEDSEAHEFVGMNIGEGVEQNLARAIDACVQIIGCRRPEPEEIDRALDAARNYTVPKEKRKGQGQKKKKEKEPRYYGLVPKIDLQQLLSPIVCGDGVSPQLKEFWDGLVDSGRVAENPHLTIVHTKGRSEFKDLWELCQQIVAGSESPMFSMKLGHVVCDDRVMAISVDSLEPMMGSESSASEDAKRLAKAVTEDPRVFLHITIGTRSQNIDAYQASTLVKSWRKGSTEGISSVPIPIKNAVVEGGLEGLDK